MNITRKIKKQKAIEILKQLDIYEPYIDGFIEENNVCFFENFGGFWIYQEPEVEAKLKEIEEKYNCLAYAVTHEFTDFGEMYSFLIVTDYPDEMDHLLYNEGNDHYAFSYVWNKTYEQDSEFGTICVKSFGGGIKRFA